MKNFVAVGFVLFLFSNAFSATDIHSVLKTFDASCSQAMYRIRLDADAKSKASEDLERYLSSRVVGQPEGVKTISRVLVNTRTDLSDTARPLGSFLFAGKTGVGKTKMVEATAEYFLNNPRAILKIDCGEYQLDHEVAKLIGSPPGYLGHKETAPALSQQALNQYHTETVKISFVLFDEVEKASPKLWNLMLGILDKATLRLGDSTSVDFSRSLIFMTTNEGQLAMRKRLEEKVFGFASETIDRQLKQSGQQLNKDVIAALKSKFAMEFLNRIDKIVVFQPLQEEHLRLILDNELGFLQQRVLKSSKGGFTFGLTPAAKDFLYASADTESYGARDIRKVVERFVQSDLAALMDTVRPDGDGGFVPQVSTGDLVEVDYDPVQKKLVYSVLSEGMPEIDVQSLAKSFYPVLTIQSTVADAKALLPPAHTPHKSEKELSENT